MPKLFLSGRERVVARRPSIVLSGDFTACHTRSASTFALISESLAGPKLNQGNPALSHGYDKVDPCTATHVEEGERGPWLSLPSSVHFFRVCLQFRINCCSICVYR